MPTNRTRQARVPVSRRYFTKKYAEELCLKDFLGQLTDDEIVVAKKHGIYKWDAWVKERNNHRGLAKVTK